MPNLSWCEGPTSQVRAIELMILHQSGSHRDQCLSDNRYVQVRYRRMLAMPTGDIAPPKSPSPKNSLVGAERDSGNPLVSEAAAG